MFVAIWSLNLRRNTKAVRKLPTSARFCPKKYIFHKKLISVTFFKVAFCFTQIVDLSGNDFSFFYFLWWRHCFCLLEMKLHTILKFQYNGEQKRISKTLNGVRKPTKNISFDVAIEWRYCDVIMTSMRWHALSHIEDFVSDFHEQIKTVFILFKNDNFTWIHE